MVQMMSRPISANATTSVRRMTGGSAPLLSGTGIPSAPLAGWRSLGEGFVGGDFAGADDLAGVGFVTELPGVACTLILPRAWRRLPNIAREPNCAVITWRGST